MTRVIDRPVLVLNRGWEPVGVFDVATAITTVIRDMGWVLDTGDYRLHDFASWRETEACGHVIRTPSGGVPAPEIIVLREYEKQPKRRVALTRRNLWRRDGERCAKTGEIDVQTRMHDVCPFHKVKLTCLLWPEESSELVKK